MSTTPQSPMVAKLERKTIVDLLESGRRLDERRLNEYRPIKIETGNIEKANGSSYIEMGKSKVVVGVKAELGEPFEDTPDKGVLTVNVELAPIASPLYEPGPPNENAIELARVVDRGLRESEAIDLEELCLIPGKQVIVIFIDIYVLNNGGNLIDASALAALSALLTSRINKYSVKKGEKVEAQDEIIPLTIKNYPITVTSVKIGKTLIIDPSLEEEQVMDGRLTITIDGDDNICAIQKGGLEVFTQSEVRDALENAFTNSANIRAKLLEEVKVG